MMKTEGNTSLLVDGVQITKRQGLIVHTGGKDIPKKSTTYYKIFDQEYNNEDHLHSYRSKATTKSLYTNPADTFDSYLGASQNYSKIDDVSENQKINSTSNNGGGGGGNGMEHRIERLETKTDKIQSDLSKISQSIAVMEEAQKHVATKSDIQDIKNEILLAIQKIPSDDKIKQIISDSNKDHKIASELFVESKLSSFFNKQLVWIIGTAIATGSLAVAILRLLLK